MTDDADVLPDVLGPGWTARTLPLRPDGGTPDPVATLVHREGTDSRRALLYVHGFVDYFLEFTPTYALLWLLGGMVVGLGGDEGSDPVRAPA